MDARFQAHPSHPDRVAHTILVINGELLRQNVQDLAIQWNRYCAGSFDYPLDIAGTYFATANGDDAMAIETADVRAGDAHYCGADSCPGGFFCLRDCCSQRVDRRLNIHYHSAPQSSAGHDSVAEYCSGSFRSCLADQRTNLAGTYINSAQYISHFPALGALVRVIFRSNQKLTNQ
jgi:hypothetical protein